MGRGPHRRISSAAAWWAHETRSILGLVGCGLLGLVTGVAALVARPGAGRLRTLAVATLGALVGGLTAVLLDVDSLAAFFHARSWALALAGALVLLLVQDGLVDGPRRRG